MYRNQLSGSRILVMSIKQLFRLILIYITLGIIAGIVESNVTQGDMAVIQNGLVGIAHGFALFTFGELFLTEYIRRKHADYLLSMIIGAKSLRFLITLFTIVVYGIMKAPEFVIFTINICLFYIVTLVYITSLNLLKNKH